MNLIRYKLVKFPQYGWVLVLFNTPKRYVLKKPHWNIIVSTFFLFSWKIIMEPRDSKELQGSRAPTKVPRNTEARLTPRGHKAKATDPQIHRSTNFLWFFKTEHFCHFIEIKLIISKSPNAGILNEDFYCEFHTEGQKNYSV